MAREDTSEGRLPSNEARRRILQHAGVVLNQARALVAQLDRQESVYPAICSDARQFTRRFDEHPSTVGKRKTLPTALPRMTRAQPPDQTLAA